MTTIDIGKLVLDLDIEPLSDEQHAARLRHALALMPLLIREAFVSLDISEMQLAQLPPHLVLELPSVRSEQIIQSPAMLAHLIATRCVSAITGQIVGQKTGTNIPTSAFACLEHWENVLGEHFAETLTSEQFIDWLRTGKRETPRNAPLDWGGMCQQLVEQANRDASFRRTLRELATHPLVCARLITLIRQVKSTLGAAMLILITDWAEHSHAFRGGFNGTDAFGAGTFGANSRFNGSGLSGTDAFGSFGFNRVGFNGTDTLEQALSAGISPRTLIGYLRALRQYAPDEANVRLYTLVMLTCPMTAHVDQKTKRAFEKALVNNPDSKMIHTIGTWLAVAAIQPPSLAEQKRIRQMLVSVPDYLFLAQQMSSQQAPSQQMLEQQLEQQTPEARTPNGRMSEIRSSERQLSEQHLPEQQPPEKYVNAKARDEMTGDVMSGQQHHLVTQWRGLENQLHFLLKFNGHVAALERSLLLLAQSLAALVSAPPEIQHFARQLTILHLSIRRHQWPLSCYEEWHQLQLLLHVLKQSPASPHENMLFWRSQLFANPWYQKNFSQSQDLFQQKDFSQQKVSKPNEIKPDLLKPHPQHVRTPNVLKPNASDVNVQRQTGEEHIAMEGDKLGEIAPVFSEQIWWGEQQVGLQAEFEHTSIQTMTLLSKTVRTLESALMMNRHDVVETDGAKTDSAKIEVTKIEVTKIIMPLSVLLCVAPLSLQPRVTALIVKAFSREASAADEIKPLLTQLLAFLSVFIEQHGNGDEETEPHHRGEIVRSASPFDDEKSAENPWVAQGMPFEPLSSHDHWSLEKLELEFLPLAKRFNQEEAVSLLLSVCPESQRVNVILRLSILWRAILARNDMGSLAVTSTAVTSTMITDADEGLRRIIQACHVLLSPHKNRSSDSAADFYTDPRHDELNAPWWTELANVSAMRRDDIPADQVIQPLSAQPLSTQPLSTQPLSSPLNEKKQQLAEVDQIAQTSQKATGHHLEKNAAAETALNRGLEGAAYAALGLSPDEIEWTGLPFALKRQAEKAYTEETERVRRWLNVLPIKQTVQRVAECRQCLEEQVAGLPQFTMDGGLVLLAPFIPTLFERAALLSEREDEHGKMNVAFSTPEAQLQAYSLLVHLLGDACSGDYCGTANILCGYDLYDVIEPVSLSDEETQETERLLESAVARWDVLKGMPVASFQSLFLQRRAECDARESGYLVQVEKQTIDILMRKLPWGVGMIQFPWLGKTLIAVDWSY